MPLEFALEFLVQGVCRSTDAENRPYGDEYEAPALGLLKSFVSGHNSVCWVSLAA